jgi:hypothetical protein
MTEYALNILMAKTYLNEYRNRIKSDLRHNRDFANWLFNKACKYTRKAFLSLNNNPVNYQQSLF